MLVVNFKSGLGNQIFQYMFYLHLKQKTNRTIYGYFNSKWLSDHNGLEIHNVFDITLPNRSFYSNLIVFICRILNKVGIKDIVANDNNFQKNAIYYDGYWQDKKYFPSNNIKLEFKNTIALNEMNSKILSLIRNSNSVSIHFRFCDYLEANAIKLYGNICTKDYYNKAIEYINKKLELPVFFVFSDDIELAKKFISLKNAYYIDWNKNNMNYLDMYLMSKCKSHIIANSSFSYWGAFLGNEGITICPKMWTNSKSSQDIALDNWIKI